MIRFYLTRYAGTITGLTLTVMMIVLLSNAPWHYWSGVPGWRSFIITFAVFTPMMCGLGGLGLDGYMRKWQEIDWDAVETRESL